MTARKGAKPKTGPVIEKQFASLVHAASDAILGVDHQGRITIWNAAATRMFGHPAKDAIGESLHDLLVPGHMLAKAKKGFKDFIKTGKGPLIGKVTECIAKHRDGSEFPVELSTSGFRQDGHWQATGIIRDITRRKQMEYALQMREKQQNTTLQSIGDAVISTDMQGHVVLMNPVAEKLTGWKGNEASGRPLEEIFHIINEESRNPVKNPVNRVLREGIVIGLANHTLLIGRDSSEIPIADSGAPIHDDQGNISGVVLVFRDQTVERKAQAAVQEARLYAESIVATIHESLLVLDAGLHVVSANHAFYRTFQVTEQETEGQLLYDLGNRQWDIPALRRLLEDILPRNTSFDGYEIENNFADIGRRTMRLNARRIYRGAKKTQFILLAIKDITERKQMQTALESSNRALRTLSSCNQVLIRAEDETQLLYDICQAIVKEGGYRAAWIGYAEHDKAKHVRPIAETGFDKGCLESMNITWVNKKRDRNPTEEAIRAQKPRIVQNIQDDPRFSSWRRSAHRHGYKSAAALPIMISDELFGVLNVYSSEPYAFNEGEINLLMELVGDIAFGILRLRMRARRIQAEEALQKSEWQYREVIKTARDAFVSMDADGIITDWNPRAEEIFGWNRNEAVGKKVAETIVPKKFREAHIKGIKQYLATKEGPVLNHQIEITALHRNGRTFPAELSIVPVHLNGDISFDAFIRDTSTRQEAKKALEKSHEQLRSSLIGTIVAVSRAVGARDPYTAGHQQRVSQLSRSIAQEMSLDAGRINGLRMGASIHDIGKINLPAEILAKPTKLSDAEFALIKGHCQVGYDILKDIEFPWPVADIAWQHHERLNGTGYPQGLKGDEICLEARIVAVADVVEAMSSHRPYRPALGIDAALEEIETHRGTWFEPAAVDACLKLFRKKKFSFENRTKQD